MEIKGDDLLFLFGAGASVDAGIPMKDIVVGCAAGKVNDEIILDLLKITADIFFL